MQHRNRFQNQKLSGVQAQPTPTNQSNLRGSGKAKPQPAIADSIQTRPEINPGRDPIAALAYQIYLQEGCPQGRAVQHWTEAEAQLAAISPVTVKTELTVTTEVTVKNEVGLIPKIDQRIARRSVQQQLLAN